MPPPPLQHRQLELFFPFDPYLLRRSAAHLALPTTYVRWRRGHPAGAVRAELASDSDSDDSDDDSEMSEGERAGAGAAAAVSRLPASRWEGPQQAGPLGWPPLLASCPAAPLRCSRGRSSILPSRCAPCGLSPPPQPHACRASPGPQDADSSGLEDSSDDDSSSDSSSSSGYDSSEESGGCWLALRRYPWTLLLGVLDQAGPSSP